MSFRLEEDLRYLVAAARGKKKVALAQNFPTFVEGYEPLAQELLHVCRNTVPTIISRTILEHLDHDSLDSLMMGTKDLKSCVALTARKIGDLGWHLQALKWEKAPGKDIPTELDGLRIHGQLTQETFTLRSGQAYLLNICRAFSGTDESGRLKFIMSVSGQAKTNPFLAAELNLYRKATSDLGSVAIRYACFRQFVEVEEALTHPGQRALRGDKKSPRNSLDFPVKFLDCRFFRRVFVEGHLVSGHFKWQPYGSDRSARRYIFVEPYERIGHVRKATKELELT